MEGGGHKRQIAYALLLSAILRDAQPSVLKVTRIIPSLPTDRTAACT